MLDDRLTSAGLALREAPVPESSLPDLAARRRRRTARRTGAVLVSIGLLAGIGLVARRDPAPVRVVDDDVVRVPAPDDRLIAPTLLPEGWRAFGLGEGGTDLPPDPVVVYGRATSIDLTTAPYLAIVDQRTQHLPRTAFDVSTGPTGLRSVPIGAAEGTDLLGTVYAWRVSDAELARVAAGVRVDGDRLVVSHVPTGMRRVPLGRAAPGSQHHRSITIKSSRATISVTNVEATGGRLARYAWLHPGATPARLGGRRVLETTRSGATTWLWLQAGRFVTLEVRATPDLPRDTVSANPRELDALARSLRLVSPARALGTAGFTFRRTIVEDTVGGVHLRVTATLAGPPGDGRVACFPAVPCVAPPRPGVIARWATPPDAVVFAVGGTVASVALHYDSGPTRLMTPVRLDRDLPRAVAAVAPGRLRRVEARDRTGRVLAVLRF